MPSTPRQLDSRIEIVTPENIAFHYVLAGPFRRLPAYLLDVTIRVGVMMALLFVVALVGGQVGGFAFAFAMLLILWFVLSWFYGGLFETLWNGQTPGKRLMGLRVLSVDGRPINAMQAVMRNVLRDVDAWPMLGYGSIAGVPVYMVGLLAMAANNRYQRLGDLVCGTIVVVEQRSRLRGLAIVEHPEVAEFAQRLPANFTISRALAQALSSYVARRERFSAARRYELARILAEPLCERMQLPADTNPDLLLCALYMRAFVADRPGGAVTPLVEVASA